MNPQGMTNRYTRHLLRTGRTAQFTIINILIITKSNDGITVGSYYDATLQCVDTQKTASGITPEHAVHRCLIKFGVTFRVQ